MIAMHENSTSSQTDSDYEQLSGQIRENKGQLAELQAALRWEFARISIQMVIAVAAVVFLFLTARVLLVDAQLYERHPILVIMGSLVGLLVLIETWMGIAESASHIWQIALVTIRNRRAVERAECALNRQKLA